MNAKLLLIAACCLLAIVQARPPRPLSTSCSASCISRTFWSGYQAGSVYTYEFDQSVQLTSELNPSQSSRLQIAGLAKVEVHSECEMALTVEVKNAQVGDFNDGSAMSPRDPPARVLAGLRAPLRFAFDNGRVVELCPGDEETRASLNLKRGILSQLQVSAKQRGQAHELEERDILGDCWTEYTPEGPNTLIKTKDLSKCKLNYHAYPLLGVKSFEDEKTQEKRPITKGSLSCRIEIDADRDIVKSTSCQEEQRQSARQQSDSIEEKIRTTTRLTLKSEESGLVNALHEVSQRTDLLHGHKTSEECHKASAWLDEDFFHIANECNERNHGAESSSEYKAKANQTLAELCEATKDQDMSREVPKKYADLIKYMRGITEQQHIVDLYKQVRNGRFCSENPLLLVIMRSIIPTIGTKQSVGFIINELSQSEDGAGGRNDWLVNGIALMQHPTAEILPELLSYVRNLRNQDQTLIMGVNRDEPLALSAVVHKICQELPNCESDSRVKAVIDYFVDSLGPACEKFTGAESDNAFVALLAIGNMGRMNGGAAPLVECATNQRLAPVYRAFALHSLRRFANISADAQSQLIELMLNAEMDAELRIAAYQALARHGVSRSPRLHDAVIRLLNDMDADRQVQMFVYTHLQSLEGQDGRQISAVLRSANAASELKKLNRRQYSNVLRGQYYSPALEAGAQAELPIVFSAQSAIPRYIGLNLTVNMPGMGQSINLMEIGMRMQGLEKLIEQTYSRIAKKFGAAGKAAESDSTTTEQADKLSEEQRRVGQSPADPRIDLLVRRYGAELSHTDLSGGILESLPSLIASGQAGNFMPAASKPGASAGTLMESTLSIPTTAGLPILIKQEMHYVTDLRSDINVNREGFEATVQVQPTAAVRMQRTVAIDAIFERAGIQSSSSFLTSTGLRVSLKNSLSDSSDRQFLVKVEPLKARQSVADVKTEVKFFQHTAGKEHVEKQLTAQQASVQTEKCIEGMAKTLGGHKICYKAESLPNCLTSPCKIFQCPSSYELFLEKSDDFGAFEVSFKWTNEASRKQLQLIVGDQKSKERLLKFNIQSINLADKINYKFELQNPIFPIAVDSNFTKSGTGHQLKSEAQIGSVQYAATGSVQPDAEKGLVFQGEFYPKDRVDQKVQLKLEHKYSGISPLMLPIATTKLEARMFTNNELRLEYDLKMEESNFFWQMVTQYKAQQDKTTSLRYRVQYSNSLEGGTDSSRVFLYDFALNNPLGKNLVHSLHSKLIRRPETDGVQYGVTVSHKLQYGAERAKSPLDFDARFGVKKIDQRDKTELTGDGELTYQMEGRSVVAKVEKVKIEIAEFINATDGLGKQYKYAVSYGIKIDDKSAEYQAELSHLPWGQWSVAKQAVELKVKAKLGSKSYAANLKHAINVEKWLSEQIAKLEYNDYVNYHLESKLKKTEGVNAIRHELFLQYAQDSKLEVKSGLAWPEEGVWNADLIVEKNAVKLLGCRHTLRITRVGEKRDHKLEHKMTLEMQASTYSLETVMKIDPQSLGFLDEFRKHQMHLLTGRYRIKTSLSQLLMAVTGMQFEHKSQLTGPTSAQQVTIENAIQTKFFEGAIWKHQVLIARENEGPSKYGISVGTFIKKDKKEAGFIIELNYKDQSTKTEIEPPRALYGIRSETRETLKITSMDSWNWHNIKMEIGINKTEAKQEAILKLEGHFRNVPVNANLNVTISRSDANVLIASLVAQETKLRLMLNSSQEQKYGELKLDGDFGFLPFKALKIESQLSLLNGVFFRSDAEIDDTKIIGAKLKVEKKSFMVDVKTGHPLLEEAGVKIGFETDETDTVKFNIIAKLTSMKKQMQIKETGSATFSINSPGYSVLLGLAGSLELEGFESMISYKKIDYELMLKKKQGMQYQIVASISCPDQTATKEPMLLFTSELNYWPFKVELKVKAKDYKGWEVKYGALAELNSENAFVGIEYNDKEASSSYRVQDLPCGTRSVNFQVKCTFCSTGDRDFLVGQANMTWPLLSDRFQFGLDIELASWMLQSLNFRILHGPTKRQILAAFKWNGSTQKLVDCTYSQTETPGGYKGEVLLNSDLRFFLGEKARAKLQASYNYGTDKELNISLNLADSDEELINAKVFWLSSPRNLPSIPVTNVDCGAQLKWLRSDAYVVRVIKSDNKYEWQSSVKLSDQADPTGVITSSIEWEDGVLKSGKINVYGREFALTSTSEGGIKVTLRTNSDEASTMELMWSGKYESLNSMRGKIELKVDGEASVAEVNVQSRQVVIKYGKAAGPNSLSVSYELNGASADLNINHETNVEKNSELSILPGYKIQVPTTRYPMKLTISARSAGRTLSMVLEAPTLGVKSMDYRHDFTNFPMSFKTESSLVSASDAKIWELKLNVDMNIRTIEADCKIGNKFKMSFKDLKFQLQIENVVDLKLDLPRILSGSDDSDKIELTIQLALPIVARTESFNLKMTLQQLTEGRQLKIQFGRGDDTDQIVWLIIARKYTINPRLDINLESSLTSKFDLLYSWQIRSLEAKLECSQEGDTDAFAYVYKDSIKINGEDLSSTVARVDGQRGAWVKKVELSTSGKVECNMKFELLSEDKPAKLTFTLDKFGDSRRKYSIKLTYSPAKQTGMLPDFRLETECPYRQFVISKEYKSSAVESMVTVEFYLNKRQSHGATVVYKVESAATDRPRYTAEVVLATRKIRMVCQPEVSEKQFNVKTTFAWDADASDEKLIELTTSLDTRTNIQGQLECKAPFLRNPMKLTLQVDNTATGYTVQFKHKNGESEVMKVKSEYNYADETKSAEFTMEISGTDNNKLSLKANAKQDSDYSYWYTVEGDLKWKIGSQEKNIKFIYRPMREITVSCDHGASMSLKVKADDNNYYQLMAFASSSDKTAARFTVSISTRTKKISIELDSGRGSFNHNSDMSGPSYTPEKLLMRLLINVNSEDFIAAIFLGEMTVGQKPERLPSESVPRHLTFFSYSQRQVDTSKAVFKLNWRSPSQDKINSALRSLLSCLTNYKRAIIPAYGGVGESLASLLAGSFSNLDSAWIKEELRNLASNDLDQLNRYVRRLLDNNEFFLRQITTYSSIAKAYINEALSNLKEALDQLKLSQKTAQWLSDCWDAVLNLYSKIPIQDAVDSIVEYAKQVKNICSYWNAKAAEVIDSFKAWLRELKSDPAYMQGIESLIDQAKEFFGRLDPVTKAVKKSLAKMWSNARTMIYATIAGAQPLAVDDILPLGMNHIADVQIIRNLYQNLMQELRVWYDTGATADEREALSQTNDFMRFFFSDESLNTWRNAADAVQLMMDGRVREGISRLGSRIKFTVWRPVCNDACQRGEAPCAAIEGETISNNSYMPKPPTMTAIKAVWMRIENKMKQTGKPSASGLMYLCIRLALGDWASATRLISIPHRTFILSGNNHLITFDGVSLDHKRPCSYLVARDFECSTFSIVQEYNKDTSSPERQVRGNLKIRFGKLHLRIERNGAVAVNGEAESLPLKKSSEENSVEAKREGDMVVVRFNGKLDNTLVVRCSRSTDSCVVSVHPLYQGRVLGLAGSNDGRRENDVRGGRASQHVNFWTAGECEAEDATESTSKIVDQPGTASEDESGDCYKWFTSSTSTLSNCFGTVDARPYQSICRQKEGRGRDACDVARQYAMRCSAQGLSVQVPSKCVACQLGTNGPVVRPGQFSNDSALKERMQVVFLVEDNACGAEADLPAQRIQELAAKIKSLQGNRNLKSVKFGFARYSDVLTALPISADSLFGTYDELVAALSGLTLSTSPKTPMNVLQVVADLPEQYQWEQLAQKHLFVITCTPCIGDALGTRELYLKADSAVKDQIYVHTISKTAISPPTDATGYNIIGYNYRDLFLPSDSAMGPKSLAAKQLKSECTAELAMDPENKAMGSVWRLDSFYKATTSGENEVIKAVVYSEISRQLNAPRCRQCSCAMPMTCRIVNCGA